MPGHLFVIQGDVKVVACDAWALPTDRFGNVTADFADALGMDGPGRLANVPSDDWLLVPFQGVGAQRGRVWLLNAGADAATPPKWYAQRGAAFVAQAAEALGRREEPGRG